MSLGAAKKAAGHLAASFIEDGMIVGIGTGSTVFFFIEKLAERCKNEGLKIQAYASSDESEKLAKIGGIHLLEPKEFSTIDITVDGADEIDAKKRMIKGGGGALLREKILAKSCQEMVVILDYTKPVSKLGKKKLPVEVSAFCYPATIKEIQNFGYQGALRKTPDGSFFITDNRNYIFDIQFPTPLENPEEVHAKLINLPGVIETGFFFNLAGRVIVGFEEGRADVMS